ncbi:MAG: PQQ-binding-like beta-propeller repeat protein, partial [Gemmatimonadaceae bacterium]
MFASSRLRATILTLVFTFAALPSARGQTTAAGEWAAYGHDALGSRYSPLAQITRENVSGLQVAWTYRTGDTTHTRQPAKFEATPLMVDGTLYLSTPFARVIALDPQTGREKWVFDPHTDRGMNFGDWANRGVSTWLDAAAPMGSACRRRIYVGTVDARIFALDARTGAVCHGFGERGMISLKRGLRNEPGYAEEYELTSPPAVINGMIVSGSAVADNGRTNAASGEVRAFDARTGKLKWSWDPV